MSTAQTTSYTTLLDIINAFDPKGGIHDLVNMLKEVNPILDDAYFMQANADRYHECSIVTGLPASTWRRYYGGIQPSKGSRKVVQDGIGMLRQIGKVDADMADTAPDKAAFMLSENQLHIDAMSNDMATGLFYGDITSVAGSTDKYSFNGLSPRFDDLSTAGNKGQIINAGGSGSDNASLWLVVWGPNTVFCVYPKGSKAGGLEIIDHGRRLEPNAPDGSTGDWPAYVTEYKWDVGLVVKDWRYVVRIANIDISDLATFGEASDSAPNLLNHAITGKNKIPFIGRGKAVWYGNQDILTGLEKMAVNKPNVNLNMDEFNGKPVTRLCGIPVKKCEALTNAEAAVA